MDYKTINYNQDTNGIVELTLNRPEKYNAMNCMMLWEVHKALQQMSQDDSVKCCLLTGAGEKAFCSGADFWGDEKLVDVLTGDDRAEFDQMGKEFLEVFDAPEDDEMVRIVFRLDHEMYDFEKPMVCAINGMALGVGWCFAQNADFLYAVEDARICYLFIRNALGTTDMSTTYFVPRQLGMPKAKELMMLGDDITGKQAEELGLINKALPSAQLMTEARKLAQRLAAGPEVALRSMKKVINAQVKDEVSRAIKIEVQATLDAMAGQEMTDAIAARGKKKEPFPEFTK